MIDIHNRGKLLSCELPCEGGINFRDQGGNIAANGRRVKNGLLFRSGALNTLSPSDCLYLKKINLKVILDYRDAEEVAQCPDVCLPDVEYYHVPANPLGSDINANIDSNDLFFRHYSKDYMIKLYQLLPFNNPAYQKLVALLQQPEVKPLVQHCAIGKDRTGVGSALVLFALGASEETVFQDYLLTEKTLATFRHILLKKMAEKLSGEDFENSRCLLDTKAEYLDAALTAIKARYSSIDGWLEKEYKLTTGIKKWIQDKYLEA